MNKLLLVLVFFIGYYTNAQIPEIFEETWHLRSLKIDGEVNYPPLGVESNIHFEDNSTDYAVNANGVENGLFGNITFSGDTFTFTDISISLLDCDMPNCYYEDLYFQSFLTTENFDLKTFTYDYFESSIYNYKSLRLTDSNGNIARYVNEPIGEPDEALFRTWYLHSMEGDLSEEVDYIKDYDPPINPTLTINEDLSFTGTASCNDFSGQFFYTNDNFDGPRLIPSGFQETGETCANHNGFEDWYFFQFTQENGELIFYVGENTNGEAYFSFDLLPGFTFNFENSPVLATNDIASQNVVIFPNPVAETLFIKTTGTPIQAVQVYDAFGKVVVDKVKFENDIDVATLQTGIYFIDIESSKGHTIKKFIKK